MRRLRAVAACVLLASAAGAAGAGCAKDTGSAGGRIDVVAGLYPLAYVAERVGGPYVRVTDLTPSGAEPHDIELTPAQVARVERADVVLVVHGLQAAVDAAARGKTVLDAGAVGRPIPGTPAHDPHVWLDPPRMFEIGFAVATRLGERDPAHASAYDANAKRLGDDLRALDHEASTALRHCARTDIVTGHEAFGHFAARYRLHQQGVAGLDPEAEPSPKRLAEIAAYVRAHHVTTVFAEALLSPKVARTIARETGATVAVLDPIEGSTGGADYLTLMRRNVATLRTALGCR